MALSGADLAHIESCIRSIPDYPKKGIIFRDITPLLSDAHGFSLVISGLCGLFKDMGIDYVVGIESRGFILGGAVASVLGCGFVPIRKSGKLPGRVLGCDYALEYGTDRVEVHADSFSSGSRLLLIDDLIATGGTACACVDVLRLMGGDIVSAGFMIDLPDLGGSGLLRDRGISFHCLVSFSGG